MKKFATIVVLLVLIGGGVYVWTPQGVDVAQRLDRAVSGEAKEAVLVVAEGSMAVPLDMESTQIKFSCAKNIAGKTITVQGGWNHRMGGNLEGKVQLHEFSHEVLRLDAIIDVGSLWSEHDMLTDALLTKGFFQVEEHPTASFVSTSIQEGGAKSQVMQGATHLIEGNLSLNGVEKSISFPAKIETSATTLTLDSKFSLNRKDFCVVFKDTAGFGLLTDDNISELVSVKLSVNASLSESKHSRDTVAAQVKVVGSEPTEDESAKATAVDVSKLALTYTETIPATQIGFEMILVPGDAEQGISAFYLGKHEVTWNEFMPWGDCADIDEEDARGELRALKLRPSAPYGAVDRNFGMDRRPALGMSRLAAELYCQWLSKQTGKVYRLPTEAEWEYAYILGGASRSEPPAADEANETAVYDSNSWDDMVGDFATKPVGSLVPNTLGVHDMAGNVCEWVIDTGDDRIARGGHFESKLPRLGGRELEVVAEWNRDYPNEPKSIWWYVNARWVGFRVVCQVDNE